ncbi:MAG: hypothetical protein E7262_07985 [Lachnospiraceae bacterium]|nr:hypothetical protein [Lachnospiraceae bacterium]
MNSQDMNIFWNQSKGQYETNDFYQDVQHPFTITADSRLKYKEEIIEDEEEDDMSEASVSIASWFGMMIMMLIPGVNVLGTLIMAFASKNENKKSFARAVVLVTLICMTVILVFMALTCDKIDYKSIFDKIFDFMKVVFVKVKGTF